MYSPLETMRVGIGERNGSSSSALAHLATCSWSSNPGSASQVLPSSFHLSAGMGTSRSFRQLEVYIRRLDGALGFPPPRPLHAPHIPQWTPPGNPTTLPHPIPF